MDKTLVIGANGQIGKLLIQMMTEQKLPVKAMLRKAEQAAEFEKMGAEVVIADLEADLPDHAFNDCDKVVFTAGSGGKTGADKHLIESHLPYTILRPGRLTDGPLTGTITTTRPTDQEQQFISRADVAACILLCLDHSETVNQIEELYQGEMPIQQAFIKSVKGRLG